MKLPRALHAAHSEAVFDAAICCLFAQIAWSSEAYSVAAMYAIFGIFHMFTFFTPVDAAAPNDQVLSPATLGSVWVTFVFSVAGPFVMGMLFISTLGNTIEGFALTGMVAYRISYKLVTGLNITYGVFLKWWETPKQEKIK